MVMGSSIWLRPVPAHQADGALAPEAAVGVCAQAAWLVAAHEAGILHRSQAREPLPLPHGTGDDLVKIVDFGISSCSRRPWRPRG